MHSESEWTKSNSTQYTRLFSITIWFNAVSQKSPEKERHHHMPIRSIFSAAWTAWYGKSNSNPLSKATFDDLSENCSKNYHVIRLISVFVLLQLNRLWYSFVNKCILRPSHDFNNTRKIKKLRQTLNDRLSRPLLACFNNVLFSFHSSSIHSTANFSKRNRKVSVISKTEVKRKKNKTTKLSRIRFGSSFGYINIRIFGASELMEWNNLVHFIGGATSHDFFNFKY